MVYTSVQSNVFICSVAKYIGQEFSSDQNLSVCAHLIETCNYYKFQVVIHCVFHSFYQE